MDRIKSLKCRECSEEYTPEFRYICENCFGPLEVEYNYDKLNVSKNTFENREKNIWRYFELLPINNKNNIIDIGAGFTPLQKATRLGKKLGLNNLYIKNDTTNPTFSFKDRPSSVAVSKSIELGLKAVGAPSTGNLAASTAAHAAKAGLPCYIFIPYDIEPGKVIQATTYGAEIIPINGTYDDANKLATQAGEKYNIGIVNVNIRPYYVEGSKTLAYEICEQLNWETPDHVIVPTGSGALLCAIQKGFKEFHKLNLTKTDKIKITSAQPIGCSPVVDAIIQNKDSISPIEKPNTIAKSLAIGEPGDGISAIKTVKDSGGYGEKVSNEEIVDSIKLLSSTEGIFAEPGGIVSLAVLRKLVENGRVDKDEKIVCYITGNGLKTPEIFEDYNIAQKIIEPKLEIVQKIIKG